MKKRVGRGQSPSESNGPLPAKLVPPALPKIVRRPRLLRDLDRARKRPIVWITAPPGAGKTTLVASYLKARRLSSIWYQVDEGDTDPATLFYYLRLVGQQRGQPREHPLPLFTPEYRPGLTVYAKRFFESLCARLSTPAALVFDNFQLLPTESHTHTALAAAFEAIPRGITVFVVSRQPTPPMVASLQVQQRIALITDDVLRVTESEATSITRLHLPRSRTATQKAQMHQWYQQSQGWMAGLILLAGSAHRSEKAMPSSGDPPQILFDYLATEVMQRLESATQDVLRATSFAPAITGEMAATLSGVPDAERRLRQLAQSAYFTEQRSVPTTTYQYHPLFRLFLQSKMTEPSEATALRQRTAALFEQAGQVDEAIELYLQAKNWTAATSLILAQAPRLMQDGRLETLARWIHQLPTELIEGTPWLLYWLASALSVQNPRQAMLMFERVLVQFETRKDLPGELMTLAGLIVVTVWCDNTWEKLLKCVMQLRERTVDGTQWPSPTVALYASSSLSFAIALHDSKPSRLDGWVQTIRDILASTPSLIPHVRTIQACIEALSWEGQVDEVNELLARLRAEITNAAEVSPIDQISLALSEAHLYWWNGRTAECRREVEQLRALCTTHGIYFPISLALSYAGFSCLLDRDFQQYAEYVKSLEQHQAQFPTIFSQFVLLQLGIGLHIIKGDLRTARQWSLQLATAPQTAFCSWPLVQGALRMAYLEWRAQHDEEAWSWIDRALQKFGLPMPWTIRCEVWMVASVVTQRLGRHREARFFLQQAMTLGARHKHFVLDMPIWDVISRCSAMALEEGIEVEYVRKLIRILKLTPPEGMATSTEWPWAIMVQTLGKLEIRVDVRPLRFGRKMPRKPLLLLQAIITHGGSISTDRAMDILWPESDGDAAYRALMMALSRLRAMLKHKDAILLQDNSLSLNQTLCWVDALAVEQLAKEALLLREKKGEHERAEVLATKAQALYVGEFLPNATHLPWTNSYREKLARLAQRVGHRQVEEVLA